MITTVIVAIWALLGLATLSLAVYRFFFATHNEEDIIRLGAGEEGSAQKQVAVARTLTVIDRWGEVLTVIIAVVGLGLASAYLYEKFNSPNPGPNNFYRMNSPAR